MLGVHEAMFAGCLSFLITITQSVWAQGAGIEPSLDACVLA